MPPINDPFLDPLEYICKCRPCETLRGCSGQNPHGGLRGRGFAVLDSMIVSQLSRTNGLVTLPSEAEHPDSYTT
jgi:hypothetical protein